MKSAKVRVRPARPTDAPRLAVLLGQLGNPCDAAEARRRLERAAAVDSRAIFVATDASGEAVAFAELRQIPSLMLGEAEAELLALVVDEKARRSGVGRALMEKAEAWTRERGCRLLRLRTQVKRLDAHAFYERLGYALLKTQHVYRKDLAA